MTSKRILYEFQSQFFLNTYIDTLNYPLVQCPRYFCNPLQCNIIIFSMCESVIFFQREIWDRTSLILQVQVHAHKIDLRKEYICMGTEDLVNNSFKTICILVPSEVTMYVGDISIPKKIIGIATIKLASSFLSLCLSQIIYISKWICSPKL